MLRTRADSPSRASRRPNPTQRAARQARNADVLAAMLEAGADGQACDRNGFTALMRAARRNEIPGVVMALLDAGADGTLRDQGEKTAFDHAQEDDALRNSDAYWRLNDAQFLIGTA